MCIYTYTYIYANFIEHNRQFLSTYFLLDLFVLPNCFHRIRQELIYILSIVIYIPYTFCPTLGHHQGRIYNKSDVTFVFAYYYYVRASLPFKCIAFAFKWVSIYIYIYIYICINECVCVCVCVCVWLCMYVCMCICMHVCISINEWVHV